MRAVYHLEVQPEELGRYVFLAGDPGRIPKIAEHFEEARELSTARGIRIWGGVLDGERVAAVGSGIGTPSTVLVLEELITLGARTFLRAGTRGSLQSGVLPGDLVIAHAAIRDEGTTRAYVPVEFPAVADWQLTGYLRESCEAAGARFHQGIVHSKDAFWSEEPDYTCDPDATRRRWEGWTRAGALATDMEASGLFIVAGMRRCRAGAVLAVVGSTIEGTLISDKGASAGAIPVAVDAMRRMIRADRE